MLGFLSTACAIGTKPIASSTPSAAGFDERLFHASILIICWFWFLSWVDGGLDTLFLQLTESNLLVFS